MKVRKKVNTDAPVFVPQDTKRHLLTSYSLSHVEPYINKQTLIGHHLGLKGKLANLLKEGDEKAIKLNDMVNGLMQDAKQNGWISPSAVYQFFPAQSDGDTVLIYDPKIQGKSLKHLNFQDRIQIHIYA